MTLIANATPYAVERERVFGKDAKGYLARLYQMAKDVTKAVMFDELGWEFVTMKGIK